MTKTFQKVLKSLSNDPGIISCKNHPFSLYKWRISYNPSFIFKHTIKSAEAEFKEFEPRLKFKTRLKWLVPIQIVFNVSRIKPALN